MFAAIVADCPFAELFGAAQVRIMRLLPLPEFLARPLAAMAVQGDSLFAQTVYGLDFSTVRPMESIAHVDAPILLIHGMSDAQTPYTDSQALAGAKPDTTELCLVPGVGHVRSFSTSPEEYSAKVVNWFRVH